MKHEINKSLYQSKIKRSRFTAAASFLAAFIACLSLNTHAAVQITQFDPPLNISAWADVSNSVLPNVMGIDFNADGEPDFRLLYGMGEMGAYFNAPTRFAIRSPQFIALGNGRITTGPLPEPIGPQPISGAVGAVPLNSVIGTSIVSPGNNSFIWVPGFTNQDDLTSSLGNHEATVIIANIAPTGLPTQVIDFSTGGILITNFPPTFPLIIGDVASKEGVMALEFNINGETHYGYIHFDFRNGVTGGVIYGWAYETESNVAIKAKPLYTSKTRIKLLPSNQGKKKPVLDLGQNPH